MLKIMITIIAVLCAIPVIAQPDTATGACRLCEVHIGISTGINNKSGMYGMTLEKVLTEQWAIEASVGKSTWGTKVALLGKLYFTSFRSGFAFSSGLTRNAGYVGRHHEVAVSILPSTFTTQPSVVNYLPQYALHSAFSFYTPIGSRVRFFMDLGWSLCITKKKFEVTSGAYYPDTRVAQIAVQWESPGGLIAATGFMCNIAGRKKVPVSHM